MTGERRRGREVAIIEPGGAIVEPRRLDAEEFRKRWLSGRNAETVTSYVKSLEAFALWVDASNPAAAIDRLMGASQGEANELAHGWRSHMIGNEGLAPNTVNARLSALRSLVGMGKVFGYVAFDLSVENVKVESYRDTRGPIEADVVRLLKLAGGHANKAKAARDVAMIMLMFGRGLRRIEVSRLDVADLDLTGARVNVLGKRRTQKEWLAIAQPIVKALRRWLRLRGRQPGAVFVGIDRHGRLLSRIAGDGIEDLFVRWGEELKVNLRPHGLRHAFVTRTLDLSGGDLRAARLAARHSSANVTIKYDDARQDLGGALAGQVADLMGKVIDDMEESDA